jgi:lysine biosynthesis protein LysW
LTYKKGGFNHFGTIFQRVCHVFSLYLPCWILIFIPFPKGEILMEVVNCISCDEPIRMPQAPKMGMLVTCADCGAELEIVWLDPLELDWPYIPDGDDEDEFVSLYEDD